MIFYLPIVNTTQLFEGIKKLQNGHNLELLTGLCKVELPGLPRQVNTYKIAVCKKNIHIAKNIKKWN